MGIFLPGEEQTVTFTNEEKSKVRIGGRDRDVVFGPWEKGPDPEHPDDCHFRPFTYVGTNKEYTDGGEINVLHRTPLQFLASNTIDLDAYQNGTLDLLVAKDGKLTTYHFTDPSQKGRAVEIPINSFVCWINKDKNTPNSVIEATAPGYYSTKIPGNFELVPPGVKEYKGYKIPPELLQAIEEADKKR